MKISGVSGCATRQVGGLQNLSDQPGIQQESVHVAWSAFSGRGTRTGEAGVLPAWFDFQCGCGFAPGETFGHAYSAVLSFENRKQMYIPRGFAHGCLTLEDDTLMQWCVDNDFCGEAAKAVRYDSDFVWQGESWPEGAYIISEKIGML